MYIKKNLYENFKPCFLQIYGISRTRLVVPLHSEKPSLGWDSDPCSTAKTVSFFLRSPLLAVRASAADRLLVREGKQKKRQVLLFMEPSSPVSLLSSFFCSSSFSCVERGGGSEEGHLSSWEGGGTGSTGGSNTIDTLSNYLICFKTCFDTFGTFFVQKSWSFWKPFPLKLVFFLKKTPLTVRILVKGLA